MLTLSESASWVFCSCFLRKRTTSSTFRLEVMLRTMPIALRRTSMSALNDGDRFIISDNRSASSHIPRQNLKNIHNQSIKNMTVLGAQIVQTIKNDELDVIVRLLDDEVDETRGSSCNRMLGNWGQ